MNFLALNLVIATTWLLLQERPSFPGFVIGFGIGYALIRLFRDVLDSREYSRRITAVIAFAVVFFKQFAVACLHLMKVVLVSPVKDLKPRIITYDITGLRQYEALLLSHLITLTPGSSAVAISEDLSTLVLHVLDTNDPDQIRDEIDRTLKRAILDMTR